MPQITAKVLSNTEYTPSIYDLRIHAPNAFKDAVPGQFVAVRCDNGVTALLRRPLSICDADNDTLRLMYQVKGKGTAMLSQFKAGDEVDLLAPLGKGFAFDQGVENAVLIGGGIGIYPLLMLAKQMKNPYVFLGFRDKSLVHMIDEFEAAGATVAVSTDDGSFGYHGRITELVVEHIVGNAPCGVPNINGNPPAAAAASPFDKEDSQSKGDVGAIHESPEGRADAEVRPYNGTDGGRGQSPAPTMIFACGPTPMLKAVQKLAFDFDLSCQLSVEERMGCGIGACLGCACKTQKSENGESTPPVSPLLGGRGNDEWEYSHVCKDGPVFDAREVIFDD